MRKAKLWLLVVVLVVAALLMLVDLSAAPRSQYTAANYERLELGMTMDEAVAILGEPGSVDRSLQDMAWVTWYSPFDSESSITAIFVSPSGELRTIEQAGDLPKRPLRMPKTQRKLRKPNWIRKLLLHKQEQERRSTLMLDPPALASQAPVLP